jgi:Tol biopolymer transport system component
MSRKKGIFIAAGLVMLIALFGCPAPGGGTTRPIELISVSGSGTQGNGDSSRPSISSDGRYVAFESAASNLVANDTNGVVDIFVYDRQNATLERVSVSNSGTEGDGASHNPSISADGRYVAFYSSATNLVATDTNGKDDIFVYGRQSHTIERVSVYSAGVQANDTSRDPTISADGRYVAFASAATNLVANDTNGFVDVFVRDRQAPTTERVSLGSSGNEANGDSTLPSISGDGRYVAFVSTATNLVANDMNGFADIFVRDRQASGDTTRVSVDSDGTQADGDSDTPFISADGRYVAFASAATNLVGSDSNAAADIFVRDRQAATTDRVSVSGSGAQSNGSSYEPSVSGDGRYVVFESDATNLVSGDNNGARDIFEHDRQTGGTSRISLTSGGVEGNGDSSFAMVNGNGQYVVFSSSSSNLVSVDTNGFTDIFVAPVR